MATCPHCARAITSPPGPKVEAFEKGGLLALVSCPNCDKVIGSVLMPQRGSLLGVPAQ